MSAADLAAAGRGRAGRLTGERLTFGGHAGNARTSTPAASSERETAAPVHVHRAEPDDWGFSGLLGFTAVLLLRPQDHFPLLNALHLAEVCALAGVGSMLFHRLSRGAPLFRLTTETVALFAFGAVMLATVPFSIWPGGALQEVTNSYLKALVVFVLTVNTLTTLKRLERMTWLILVCVGYIAARGVFDYARGVNLVEGGRLAGPVGGIFGNPNDLALNMVTFIPIAAMVAVSRWQPRWRRASAALMVALMTATAVFSKSRGGAVGLLVMLGALLIMGRRVRPQIVPVALVAALAAMPLLPASFWARMGSIVDERQDRKEFTGSREARRIVMQEGLDAFIENPLTGVGAGQFKNYNPPGKRERWKETHNALIQVGAETGVLGLALFAFLIVRAATAAAQTRRMLRWPRTRTDPDPLAAVFSVTERRFLHAHTIGMSVGLIGWFVCSMFASVAYGWTFYYLLGLTVAARDLTRERQMTGRKALALARSSQTGRWANDTGSAPAPQRIPAGATGRRAHDSESR